MKRRGEPTHRTGGGGTIAAFVRRRAESAEASESGQALVMVLIVLLLLVLIAPIVVAQVTSEDANVGNGQNFEGALAAAEAGVQQYRNLLDVNSDYWRFTSANDDGDVALDVNGWKSIPSSSPPEAFHYIVNSKFLSAGAGAGVAAVLLTVTGRSGPSGHYVYRTIQATLQSHGILTNAYFSQYEVLDPAQDTAVVCVTPSASTPSCTGNGCPCSPSTAYTVLSAPPLVPGQSFWQSLCNYETYQQNTFVDSLGVANPYAGGNYSVGTPYYGAYRGTQPNSGGNNSTFTYTYASGQKASVTDPCGPIYNFVTGENFTGPVYTNDQLWMCGNPSFSAGLTSGVPAGFQYAYSKWPTQNGAVSGTGGWIDNGLLNWDNSCGGVGQSAPNFNGHNASPGGNSHLPPLNASLQTVAAASGCLFTGPTMIEFVAGGKFNVWSPLTPGSGGSGCGTFSNSAPFQQGLNVPITGLVIYVQNALGTATIPFPLTPYTPAGPAATRGALPTGATCLDPWKPYTPGTKAAPCPQAYQGDAIVEGEYQGEITVGAANNIIISRDLTAQCADASGVSAQQTTSYSISASGSTCVTEANPDVMGLVANADVVISKPGVELAGSCALATACSPTTVPTGTTDNIGTTQTEPFEWPAIETSSGSTSSAFCGAQANMGTQDGTEAQNSVVYAVPDCEIQNPVIDAAIVALGGSLADEDWFIGPSNAGSAWVQGTDISYFRGPFGEGGQSGYTKEFAYDTRLSYLTPPNMIDITDLTWSSNSFVDCGNINDETVTDPNGTKPSGGGVCPGLTWLNA